MTLIGLIFWGNFTKSQNEYCKDTIPKTTLAPQVKSNYPTVKSPEGFNEIIEYKPRQFEQGDMFLGYKWNVKYPEELTLVNEKDLTSLSCTRTYWQDLSYPNNFVTNEEGETVYSLTNEKLLSYIRVLNDKYAPKHVMRISVCNTEDGKAFVFYGISMGGGGGYWGKPYIGIDNGEGIKETVENIGSGGCSALQLLQNEFLYIKCSASEGGGGEYMVFQINLSNKSTSRLIYCFTEGSKLTCR